MHSRALASGAGPVRKGKSIVKYNDKAAGESKEHELSKVTAMFSTVQVYAGEETLL